MIYVMVIVWWLMAIIGEWLLMVVNGDLMVIYVMVIVWWLPSGKLTVRYWKWPFIVGLPIKNGDFP
jgi:hypothetical protein